MALHRGIQSAIFYYLSCAPCADARYRKQRKEEAKRGRAEREALEAEIPNLYRHPSPSSTNPYWGSEISAGPVLSSRGRKTYPHANGSQRGLKASTTRQSDVSGLPSSTSLAHDANGPDGAAGTPPTNRDDMYAATVSAERLPSRSTTVSRSTLSVPAGITKPPPALTRGHTLGELDYTSYSNPHVNDLVPAVATLIGSREDAAWLMKGPPSSEFMSGREDNAARSRSDSGASGRYSARSTAGIPLSREISRRILERRNLTSGADSISRKSSTRTANDPLGQRHDRITSDSKDFATHDSVAHSSPQRAQMQASEDSTQSALTVLRSPPPSFPRNALDTTPVTRTASRPQLSTIVSSDHISSRSDASSLFAPTAAKENGFPLARAHANQSDCSLDDWDARDRVQRRIPMLEHDADTLRAMRRGGGGGPNGDAGGGDSGVSSNKSTSALVEPRPGNEPRSHTRSPESTDQHEGIVGDGTTGTVAFIENWHTPDFALPDWVHEHTKREVSQRWSMDI